jgi:hypothetical protein
MSEDRLRAFMAAYGTALEKAVTEHPDEYGYPVSGVPAVVNRMRRALEVGSYNHAGRGFAGACRALGLKHTRRAIENFLHGA